MSLIYMIQGEWCQICHGDMIWAEDLEFPIKK